ncbi:transcriptional regulator [Streptomyces longisporoflavus]|uniref:ArsR/SmtB family transcription factor n=1 Tax=Streptomyces longisporoflavus TaxID=28044 RepID=UPI00167CF206|nr:metalloregulator ArsR/SmtB family transcription factor [Streptomyces longisporoflavus]GGV28788.1 transcriptional regulator [Streptomyces longisporoflavus]
MAVSVEDPEPAGERERAGRVPAVLGEPLMERDHAERVARVLKAIADPTRLQLLHLIQTAPCGEACVGELTERLGLRQPTVSHHLKTMNEAGLLARERRGTWVWYSADPEGLRVVREILRAPARAEG